jgi:hypothetical protein
MLRTLEWANIGLLGVVLLWWLPAAQGIAVPVDTWQRTAAYLPVAGLLAVGGWYWHRKRQQLRQGRPLDGALRILDRVDRATPWLLAVGTAAVGLSLATGTGRPADRAWATGLLLFAWAEYVNYFRVQLMHDTRSDLARLWRTRRLRRSWLATDLAHWRARRARSDARDP